MYEIFVSKNPGYSCKRSFNCSGGRIKLTLSIVSNKLLDIPLMLAVLPDIAFVIELHYVVPLSERQSLNNFGKFLKLHYNGHNII